MNTNYIPKQFHLLAILALSVFLAHASPAQAHPHVFVDCEISFIFNEQGLAGFHEKWTLDDMFAIMVLDMVDMDRDSDLSKSEVREVEKQAFSNLKEYNYFTVVFVDGMDFPVTTVQNFNAYMDGTKIVYEFFVPCPVKASSADKEIEVAVFDDSFWTCINYANESGVEVDPFADPVFMDMGDEASPDDYKRFAEMSGLSGDYAQAKIKGPVDAYAVDQKIISEPEMSYFFEQIIPEAFVLRFRKK